MRRSPFVRRRRLSHLQGDAGSRAHFPTQDEGGAESPHRPCAGQRRAGAAHPGTWGSSPGAEVEVVGRAPLRDPVALRLPGFTLSLRNNEADYIVVEPLEQAG